MEPEHLLRVLLVALRESQPDAWHTTVARLFHGIGGSDACDLLALAADRAAAGDEATDAITDPLAN